MATDPVEMVSHTTFGGPRSADLSALMRRLAALPPARDAPYLTVSADLRPEGSAPDRRPGVDMLERAIRAATQEHAAHTSARECLDRDAARIAEAIRSAPSEMLGFFAVACGDEGVFESIAVQAPLPTSVALGPTPRLLELARLAEEQPACAVLTADGREAMLVVVSAASPDALISVQANGYPRKQMQGGWSQQRYQARADERLEAFARVLAAELRRLVESKQVDLVVLATDEPMRSALHDELHQMVRERLAGQLPLALDLSPQALAERAAPVIRDAARRREQAQVAAVREGAGPGGRSVVGIDETLAALQTGQVMTLVMNDDFAAAGWADFDQGVYGTGAPPRRHPAGGDLANLREIDLAQELARLALQFDAAIEVVQSAAAVSPGERAGSAGAGNGARTEAARALDALGGVGAILRYTLTPDRSTADM